MPRVRLGTLRAAVQPCSFSHPGFRVPLSEYYERVCRPGMGKCRWVQECAGVGRLPLHRQPSPFVLVRFTDRAQQTVGVYRASLVLESILSLHMTDRTSEMPPRQGCRKGGPRPFTPEDPSEPRRILCGNGSVGIEFRHR